MRNIVNAVFLGPEGVLLARRSPHRKAYGGLWSFPGGHVEPGESLEQALAREVEEELGVSPRSFTLKCRIKDPNTGPETVTYHLFVVHAWDGHPRIMDDEHTELRWFTAEQAKSLNDLALDEYRGLFDLLRQPDYAEPRIHPAD